MRYLNTSGIKMYVDGYLQSWDSSPSSMVSYIENNGGRIVFGNNTNGKAMNLSFFYFYNNALSDEELEYISTREGNPRWTQVPEEMNNPYWIERLSDLRFATDLDNSSYDGAYVQDKSPLGSHGGIHPNTSLITKSSFYGNGIELNNFNDSINFENGALMQRYLESWSEFTFILSFKSTSLQINDSYYFVNYGNGPRIVSYPIPSSGNLGIATQNASSPSASWVHHMMSYDGNWVNLSGADANTYGSTHIIAFQFNGTNSNKFLMYVDGNPVTISPTVAESILTNIDSVIYSNDLSFYSIGRGPNCNALVGSLTYGNGCAPKNTTFDFVYVFDKAFSPSELINITLNTTKTLTNGSIFSNQGITLYNSNYNNLTSNTISTKGTNAYALTMYSSNNNSVLNNILTSDSSYDIFSETSNNSYSGTSSNDNSITTYGVNLTLSLSNVQTSSSTPSSSSVGTPIVTHSATETQIQEGYTNTLGINSKINFNLGSESHVIKLTRLTSKTATINVSSNKSYLATFSIGDARKFELNGDNFYDLLVKLNSIKNSKANFTIQMIHESITPETIKEEQKKEEQEIQKEIKKKITEKLREQKYLIISFLIVLTAIIFILVNSFRRKKRKKMYGF